MSSMHASGAAHGSSGHTVTALSRWSVLTKQLPAVDKIKVLHVYDFDNTLFKTPLPNPALWSGPTIGTLSNPDAFINGGWWHDSRILAATGQGVEKEEPRAWEGWWNEKVVELVQLSMRQKDALCVLLTGRSERGFAELIKRMVTSKGLDFDMIGLKPAVSPTNQRFNSTMHFKQLFLEAMMETYRGAEEIRVYEDRTKHVKGFRDFFAAYNHKQNGSAGVPPTRAPIQADVVQVADMSTTLDPVIEVAEVQQLINEHNEATSKMPPQTRRGERLMIKKTVFFTAYMISVADTQRLSQLVQLSSGVPGQDLKYHANSILICPRPCPPSILEKVGGMGSKMRWEVTGTACYENSIWAACLRPVPVTAKFHTDNPIPLVVLALRKGSRPNDAGKIQNWQPVPADKKFIFETTVGEKMILRIESEDPREDEYESLFANKASKRKHNGEEEYHPRQTQQQPPTHPHGNGGSRGYHTAAYGRGGPQGGRGNHRGGGTPNRAYRNGPRGAGKGGRGGRGGHGYRSLDDVDPRNQQGGNGGYGYERQVVEYEDGFPQPQPPSYGQPPQAPAAFQAQPHGGWSQGAPIPPTGPAQNRPAGYAAPGSDLQNYY